MATLKHSFPQRFAQAFAAEVEAFAEVVLDGATWPVSERDCVIVQTIAQCGAESKRGQSGKVCHAAKVQEFNIKRASCHRVRGIGAGSFGTYIRQLVTKDTPPRLEWLPGPSFTRSSGLDWEVTSSRAKSTLFMLPLRITFI